MPPFVKSFKEQGWRTTIIFGGAVAFGRKKYWGAAGGAI